MCVACGCWTWSFLNTPHPYLVPILFSSVHPYIFFKIFIMCVYSSSHQMHLFDIDVPGKTTVSRVRYTYPGCELAKFKIGSN